MATNLSAFQAEVGAHRTHFILIDSHNESLPNTHALSTILIHLINQLYLYL